MSATLPEPDSVEGTVRSIVFHNEENGYTIMHVTTATGDLTVMGNLPAVVEGEQVKAYGRWRDDKRFGRQFQADRIQAVAPTTAAGIERFLASGLVEGIGKAYAKRIVAKFGTDTFRIIEEESKRLEEVSGIGTARRHTIKDSWNRQKSVRDIMIFLHEHGLSTARALRLHKTYGPEAVNILRSDPYRLARELPGVGFKTADEIARKMGQADDDPRRIEAGILHVLGVAEKQGHCALPRDELTKQAVEILGAPETSVTAAIDRLLLGARIVVEDDLVFPIELHQAETAVAEAVRALLGSKPSLPDVDAGSAVAWFERHHSLKLGDEQAQAVAEAVRHRFSVITGGPGTGKTTILLAVLRILEAKKIDIVLCAPTGRAAHRLSESTGHDATTIHRLLDYQPHGGFARNAKKPLEGDYFVVDEASMIDIHLMASLMEAIPPGGNVLLVGDVDQLPSVGPGNVLRDIIESGSVPVSRLVRIYRQAAASRIVTAAHDVNEGRLPPLDNPADADFFFLERNGPEAIAETIEHLVKTRIPEGFQLDARDDVQVLTPMNKQSLGTRELNSRLQKALNPPGEFRLEIERFQTVFRTGDKVIQTRNDYEREVFNGDIGHIAEITTEPAKVFVSFSGHPGVEYEPGDLDELSPAYAITIHKSQGSEFPAVVIPLASQHYVMLQRNLLYTAITRGKRLVILVGERRALEMAVKNVESAKRWTGLAGRLASRS